MKKIYLVLLILAVFVCISSVSAAENASDCDCILDVDDACEISAVDGSDDSQVLVEDNNDDSGVLTDNNDSVNSAPEINQVPTKVSTKNIKSTYGTQAKFSLKLFDQNGDVIVGKTVKFKVPGNTYNIKTDSNGIATLNLNYNAGKYTIKYSVGDLTGTNTYTVKNKITMKIFKWGNKGDISKIKLLKKNMPNNKWVKEAVKAAKKGNPLLTFQGGKGKKVFMTAGVHGNELSSIVAAMKLIAHLSKNPIKGTVYIIPFVNIKAITKKVRHTGADYNRIANKAGTIPYKIVKLAAKYNCDAFGDFHTTQPGGIPGKNIVLGFKSPVKKCISLTNYIVKHAKVNKKFYKYAGAQFPGTLAENANKKNIPGVICEVVLPHNTVTTKSVKISYKMMDSFLKFNSII